MVADWSTTNKIPRSSETELSPMIAETTLLTLDRIHRRTVVAPHRPGLHGIDWGEHTLDKH